MKTIRGSVELPPDAPAGACRRLVVEVRDVSAADAPSVVVAEAVLEDVALEPNGRVPFQVAVPDAAPGRELALRVHASRDGSPQPKPGDLLSTTRVAVPPGDHPGAVAVPVKVI